MTTCERVVRDLTELEEGALPLAEAIRARLHLLHCPQCRRLVQECRRLPAIMGRISTGEDEALLAALDRWAGRSGFRVGRVAIEMVGRCADCPARAEEEAP